MDYTPFIAHCILNIVVTLSLLVFFVAVVRKNGWKPVWLAIACVVLLLGIVDITIQYTNLVLYCSGSELAMSTHSAGVTKLAIDYAIEKGKAKVFPWPFTKFIIEFLALDAIAVFSVLFYWRLAAHHPRTKEM